MQMNLSNFSHLKLELLTSIRTSKRNAIAAIEIPNRNTKIIDSLTFVNKSVLRMHVYQPEKCCKNFNFIFSRGVFSKYWTKMASFSETEASSEPSVRTLKKLTPEIFSENFLLPSSSPM